MIPADVTMEKEKILVIHPAPDVLWTTDSTSPAAPQRDPTQATQHQTNRARLIKSSLTSAHRSEGEIKDGRKQHVTFNEKDPPVSMGFYSVRDLVSTVCCGPALPLRFTLLQEDPPVSPLYRSGTPGTNSPGVRKRAWEVWCWRRGFGVVQG